MVAKVPEEAEAILQVALQKIGLALAEANRELVGKSLQDYAAVAGSLFYNNPEVHSDVPAMSIGLKPLDYGTDEERDFEEEEEQSTTVATHSSQRQEIVDEVALRSTSLVNSASAVPGACCEPGKSWKRIYLPGSGVVVRCLPDSAC